MQYDILIDLKQGEDRGGIGQSEEDTIKAAVKKLEAVYGDFYKSLPEPARRNVRDLKEMLAGMRNGVASLIGADTIVEESNSAGEMRKKLVRKNAVSSVNFLN
jgi:hypothetical protein